MKRIALFAVVFMCLVPAVSAQARKASVPARVAGYVKTHKELILADALVGAAWSLDAWSSARCQRISPTGCIEQNPIVGPHPTSGQLYGFALGFSAAQITMNHLLWHYAPSPDLRHMIWFFDGPFIGFEAWNINHNIDSGNILRQEQARARLARD